ncbi:hypothetical protein OG500_19445 [Kitasatospora sp. NBC_01250]|uniref:hypothetical protein n=1 Tax=unclassified Kitasatospora TaxID=2633591 RepID=UPI002E14A80D|nr:MULTISPECIES: hypothetical protein [unclassified Kitasatospora]WSJ68257.1 hypothetical protein OG294_20235 [Kitasatospora sp. NBC_01302]
MPSRAVRTCASYDLTCWAAWSLVMVGFNCWSLSEHEVSAAITTAAEATIRILLMLTTARR